MPTINHFRVFCNTESIYTFGWSIAPLTYCPNNISHSIDTSSLVVIDTITTADVAVTNFSKDTYQNMEIIQKTPIIDLKSFLGISPIRNIINTTGSASVVGNVNDSEICLSISGTSDSASIVSAERGRYTAGLSCEVGMALRLPSTLVGNQTLKWGYFDDTNGLYFKLSSTDFNVCIMRNSVETVFSQSQFNIDKLDGSGSSGLFLNFTDGNIFKIKFSWYGYGVIEFGMVGIDGNNSQRIVSAHRYQPIGHTSVITPNLPISLEFKNNGTLQNSSVYLAGRQFSMMGQYNPSRRTNSFYRYNSFNPTSFTPLFSLQRKSNYLACNVILESIDIQVSGDTLLQIITNSSLTTPNFINIPTASESALLCDSASVSYSNGNIIYNLIIFAGTNVCKNLKNYNINLIETNPITIITKSLTGILSTITVCLTWTEEW